MRGTLTTGSSMGFITINPLALSNAGLSSVFLSTASTFAGVVVPIAGAAPTGTAYLSSNSPFNGGTTGAMPRVRVVAAGVRVRYSGTELNRGGNAIPWRARNIAGTNCTGWGFGDFAASNQSQVKPCTRKWIGTVFTPVTAGDRNYFVTGQNNGIDVSSVSSSRVMAILITAPGTPVTYEYDIVAYFEAISSGDGSNDFSVPNLSSSDSDVDGYSFIRDAYAKLADSEIGQVVWDTFLASARNYTTSHIPFLQGASAMALGWK